MMNAGPVNFTQLFDWIVARKSFLLLTHQRPDGDAFGSLLGVYHCLHNMGLSCHPYVGETVPRRYHAFMPPELTIGGAIDLNRFDGIIAVDSANEKRLMIPNKLQFCDLPIAAANIDHHIDNSRYGVVHHIDSQSAATAEIIANFCKEKCLPMDACAATLLLLGIITDTGGFRFNNTTAATHQAAAWLIKQGAERHRIMQEIFFSEPVSLLKLQADVLQNLRFALQDQIAYFFLTPELLSKYNVDLQETEDLIDSVRVVKGPKIICRMQLVENGVRFSLRSFNPDVPVNEIAKALGGGGHVTAAGASIENIDLVEGERLLLEHAQKVLS
jgi:phosphoesterase RecJ-like protein